MGDRPESRELLDGSYHDEIRCLQLSETAGVAEILSTRYDSEEDLDSARTALFDLVGS
jgi:hypothetical protein